jgi:uncharacterized membrane protein
MKQLVNNLKGDKVIWSFMALLALFSFMPVLVQVVIWLIRAWNRKYFGLFGKTFGAYLYRFSDNLRT